MCVCVCVCVGRYILHHVCEDLGVVRVQSGPQTHARRLEWGWSSLQLEVSQTSTYDQLSLLPRSIFVAYSKYGDLVGATVLNYIVCALANTS